VSRFLGGITDTVIILIIVIVNAVIGFVQEYRAEKRWKHLRCNSWRNKGTWAGNNSHSNGWSSSRWCSFARSRKQNPRWCSFYRNPSIKVDESTLTGESNTIDKSSENYPGEYSLGDYSNLGFKGTFITRTRKRLCHGNRHGYRTWSHCTDDSITRFINSITNTIGCIQ
jgi:Ca2+-transporting ATPase